MHPFTAGELSRMHRDELLREAASHRLARVARQHSAAGRSHGGRRSVRLMAAVGGRLSILAAGARLP